jgi:hypothetical protein
MAARARDGGTVRADLGCGGSLLQRLVRLGSLTQKWRSDVLGLVEGFPWPRTLSRGGAASSDGS